MFSTGFWLADVAHLILGQRVGIWVARGCARLGGERKRIRERGYIGIFDPDNYIVPDWTGTLTPEEKARRIGEAIDRNAERYRQYLHRTKT